MMKALNIPEAFLKSISQQAEKEYPHECCGMLLGPKNKKEVFSRIRPCQNAQTEYHELDAENFPRTAETAYFMAPKELLTIQKELREADEEIRIIYHSHINAGAYFSEEDTRIASAEGEPAYPGVDYLVVSVLEGKVKDWNLFRWDNVHKEYRT